jgi:hypothetical protein
MKNIYFFFLMLSLLTSCNNVDSRLTGDPTEKKIKKQVIRIAESHVRDQMKDARKTITKDGLILFSDGEMKCLIDPVNILIGEIDEDAYKDAIVTIFTFVGQRLPLKEHLILLNKNGKLSISKELTGEMKFLKITDRTIFIETSHMAPDSPFADCPICKEIKKYKFIAGDTVRIK